ncbi:MAG: leucine-rich repeat domain-containing protein [Treponema sp.]|nr:leucine-rich repeat domain-containing protein [Treponema sp.]
MRNFSKLAIVVSHEGNDDSDFYELLVKMSNGSNSVQCSDFESALGMLPPGSEVSVIANGTVGNKTVHRFARVIKESCVFVALDLSQVTELAKIYDSPFQGNENLREIHFPKNLKSINENAFSRCSNLVTVSIPATCEQIGVHAFAGCEQLRTINFADYDGWAAVNAEKQSLSIDNLSVPDENPSKFVFRTGAYYDCQLMKSGQKASQKDFEGSS